MRIFTRLTRHIDILLGFNFGRVPPQDGTLITFGRSFFLFFVSRPRPEYWAGVAVVSQNEKKEERFSLILSLSFRFLGSFAPFVCTGWGGDSGSHITWKGVARSVARLLARSI